MPTERQAIDRLRREAEMLRHLNDRQAEERFVQLPLAHARVLIQAWDERNPNPPGYPAAV